MHGKSKQNGLASIDLAGFGGFHSKQKAAFKIEKYNLPGSWDYILKNEKMLLRLDQSGPLYAQANPPSDIIFFKREPLQQHSSWLIWLSSNDFKNGSFTNFFKPLAQGGNPSIQPQLYTVEYQPHCAVYTVVYQNIKCTTEITVPYNDAAICLNCAIENLSKKTICLSVIPVLQGYFNFANLAPWDKPEWYLKTAFFKEKICGFLTHLSNADGNAKARRDIALLTSAKNLTQFDVSYEKFAGCGDFANPQAVYCRNLSQPKSAGQKIGIFAGNNSIFGYPPVNAAHYKIKLPPDRKWKLQQTLVMLDRKKIKKAVRYLEQQTVEKEKAKVKARYEKIMSVRSISTPDKQFDDYVNQWLAVQLDWVASLDRGWPSGMRGCRDAANDFTAMAAVNPKWSKKIILELFSCQKTNGWLPRQYSAAGRSGKHDLRNYTDAGCWAIELLYEYLCRTKDFGILELPLPWLDSDKTSPILRHCLKAVDYFIDKKNIGRHNLCKIWQGDWLDSANKAGLQGKGESVMVSAQTIIALQQCCDIMGICRKLKKISPAETAKILRQYQNAKVSLEKNLQKHALNKSGYFNGLFNDEGKWIFSDKDPDGCKRFYAPANWFAVISGAAKGQNAENIFSYLDFLKSPQGYRLYWPPFGRKAIGCVGRAASGDQPAGLWENGNVYNQGSHGFLARALAAAGKGDLLYKTIKYMLPYEQQLCPIEKTMTAPYAVVNCRQEANGFEGRGGLTFLTGTIAYALRAVYDWLFGIQPQLDGLAISPCLPCDFSSAEANFKYLGKKVKLAVSNGGSEIEKAAINGQKINSTICCPITGRKKILIGDSLFKKQNLIVIKMAR